MFSNPAIALHAMERLLLAAALGAILGLEREHKHKPAGLRTIMLITFGSALFTLLSEFLAQLHGGDPQRIAAQLITGIGFLGAGAIIQARGTVIGLTTAAVIFVSASIGMAAGSGMPLLAIVCTVLLLLVLVPVGALERRFETRIENVSFSFKTQHPENCLAGVRNVARIAECTVGNLQVRHSDNECTVDFDVQAPVERLPEVFRAVHEMRNQHE